MQLHGIMLRRTKDEVLDLPPKLRTWIDVDIHERARERLNEVVRSFLGSPTEEPERDQRGRRRGIGQLSSARRTLAVVKARQTCEFIDGVVDQGEKVLVFSAFVNPIQRFSKHFGEQAVTITGEAPVGQRQGLVERFHTDDSVRVYVGQIHAGGTGVNLTAARQVVFNDLDWVPANHWQAEDRAYRIGQTGTVNVTYVVARGTIEEFVRTVLETKARIVDDLVEGKALGADLDSDAMTELRRMIRLIDRQFEQVDKQAASEEQLTEILRAAGEAYLDDQAGHLGSATREALILVSEGAIKALAQVLEGEQRAIYRIASSRDESIHYTLEVVGADITCDCKGFSYRGACNHSRTLKDKLVSGEGLPEEYEKVE